MEVNSNTSDVVAHDSSTRALNRHTTCASPHSEPAARRSRNSPAPICETHRRYWRARSRSLPLAAVVSNLLVDEIERLQSVDHLHEFVVALIILSQLGAELPGEAHEELLCEDICWKIILGQREIPVLVEVFGARAQGE